MSENEEYLEEEFFQTSKDARQQRRRARLKDRSKFKKTDHAKRRPQGEIHPHIKKGEDELREGRVLSIQSEYCTVESEEERIQCTIRGVLKLERTREKNLLAVGDLVLFEIVSEGEGCIVHVKPRRSVLCRADNISRRKQHIIAVNVDQVIITASVVAPPIKPSLIDRYVIAARQGQMEPIIVINKVDLLGEESLSAEVEKEILEEAIKAYDQAGIPLFPVSTVTGEGLDALKAAMHAKVSVFSGQSGAGKSSLINGLTGLELPVGEVVSKTLKGAHTTTTAQLLPLEDGGWCVDTPGIKSFGVWQLRAEEVQDYFTEIKAMGVDCHYPDCSHTHEPHCAVQEAVEWGQISALRFESYCQLMASVQEKYRRR